MRDENKLKEKKLSTGMISLYIEYYKESTSDLNGKCSHIRDFEFLKIYLHQNPKDAVERKENKENRKLAEDILSIRQSNYLQGKFIFKNLNKSKRQFLNFFAEKMEKNLTQLRTMEFGNQPIHILKIV